MQRHSNDLAKQAERQRRREIVAVRAEQNRADLAEERAKNRARIAQLTAEAGPAPTVEASRVERYLAAAKRAEADGNDAAAEAYLSLAVRSGWVGEAP
jgi:hypothetical protein